MSIISDLFVSSPDLASGYDELEKRASFRVESFSGLTFQEFSDLMGVVLPDAPPEAAEAAFRCVFEACGGERLIHEFPDAFVRCLAALDDQAVANACVSWCKVGELAYLGCSGGDVAPIVESLRRLSKIATHEGSKVYLWMCV